MKSEAGSNVSFQSFQSCRHVTEANKLEQRITPNKVQYNANELNLECQNHSYLSLSWLKIVLSPDDLNPLWPTYCVRQHSLFLG